MQRHTEVEGCEDRRRDRNDAKDRQQPLAARRGCPRASGGSAALMDFGFLDSRSVREHISVVLNPWVCGHLLAVTGNEGTTCWWWLLWSGSGPLAQFSRRFFVKKVLLLILCSSVLCFSINSTPPFLLIYPRKERAPFCHTPLKKLVIKDKGCAS